jgi:hypothetical protein
MPLPEVRDADMTLLFTQRKRNDNVVRHEVFAVCIYTAL